MAGEIGHMLPGPAQENAVNYENVLCNDAVSRQYRELKNAPRRRSVGRSAGDAPSGINNAGTISDLCALADSGDEAAGTVIRNLLDRFAVVLLNSIVVLDPQVVILGGDACCFKESEISHLKQKIEPHFMLVQNIVPSMLDKKACLYGAIKKGLDRVEERITNIW